MTELAHVSLPLHFVSLDGHSSPAMFDTEPNEHEAARVSDVDTLGAQDGEVLDDARASLDDRLLHRDLKARIFGADTHVAIGRYEVLRRVGRGGMGTVYVAHDPELDRKVALKVLRADRKSGRERMLQEARALARLAHPNVVTVHEVGLHDDRVFVAMELVQGKTLRAWLEARPGRAELYGVFLQAARGLQAAHRAGLVHRDFKPDNVLIGDDGRVRVVDFGVAKAWDTGDSLDPDARALPSSTATSSTSEPSLTLTGQLLGTPAYMAPEQFLGASVDARTDVFAFCVTLYEALSGQRPFAGDDTASVSWSVLQGQARPLEASDVPGALVALVRQGLSRSADERPASLDGLIGALEAAGAPARPRRPRAAWWGASLVALGGGGLLAFGTMDHRASEPPAIAPVMIAAAAAEAPSDEAEPWERQLELASEAAFTRLVLAPDEDERLLAAEEFLGRFGDTASEVRLAIAESTAGDILWRRSCPEAIEGLCIAELPIAIDQSHCSTPRRGTIQQRQRLATLVEPARRHLQAAAALAGVRVPEQVDDETRAAFAEAIGRARVQLADAELESYLTLDVPDEIDFEDARALSASAFVLFFKQLTTEGSRLMADYAKVKQAGDPRWILVAAARTGMVSETAAAGLARTPVPTRLSPTEREQYCGAIDEHLAAPSRMAHDVYAYCVEKADERGLAQDPIAAFCRARLEQYPELPAK